MRPVSASSVSRLITSCSFIRSIGPSGLTHLNQRKRSRVCSLLHCSSVLTSGISLDDFGIVGGHHIGLGCFHADRDHFDVVNRAFSPNHHYVFAVFHFASPVSFL